MKLFMTFIVAVMLGLSGSFALADDVTGRFAADRPMTHPGDAEDIFLARVPAGAALAVKDDEILDLKVEDLVGIMARDVAVKWKAVRSERDAQDRVVVNVDVAMDQLRHAPAFAGI
jgi:hypothetical protein